MATMKGPVVVVGTGRSGTSTVARILHDKFGVCIGHFMRLHTIHDYHEDLLAHALNRMLGQRAVSVIDWRVALAKSHARCEDWGFKDPYFLYVAPSDIKAIQPRLFIRTWRPVEQTVESWLRHNEKLGGRGDTPDNRILFHRICMEREMLMDWKLEGYPVVTIRFDTNERSTDEEIAEQIKPHLVPKEREEASA
jgi:hypothetical protein